MNYLTIPDVELVTVGMGWTASSGPVTFTLEHLADAVVAANDDPHVLLPRLKLGHTDERFNEGPPSFDPFVYDAVPAFGRASNLRLENDGAVIVADYIEVPEWLADALPSAFPSRSVEGDWDVETPGGKSYTFVLTAVALLGVSLPAVQDLEDLERLFTEGFEPETVSSPTTSRRTEEVTPTQLRADVDKVVRAFYSEFAQDDRYWWWPRAVWTDPNEIIADDDEDSLWRVPFSSSDDQSIEFGDPVEVKETFVDVASGESVAAVSTTNRQGKPAAVFAARDDESLPVVRRDRKAESRPEPKEAQMGLEGSEIRKRLGLAEDATDEEVSTKLDELTSSETPEETPEGETPEETPEEETPEGETPEEETPAETPEAETPEPAVASDGTVSLDPEEYKRLRAGAEAGAQARQQQVVAEHDRILDDAVKAGKFPPARRDHWKAMLSADPEGAKATIANLATGLVPVTESGVGGHAPGGDGEAYPASWLPEVAARAQGTDQQNGNRNRVQQEV